MLLTRIISLHLKENFVIACFNVLYSLFFIIDLKSNVTYYILLVAVNFYL